MPHGFAKRADGFHGWLEECHLQPNPAKLVQGGDIEVAHPTHLVDLGLKQGRRRTDACIVDQYGDASVGAQHLFDPREIRPVVQVGDRPLLVSS